MSKIEISGGGLLKTEVPGGSLEVCWGVVSGGRFSIQLQNDSDSHIDLSTGTEMPGDPLFATLEPGMKAFGIVDRETLESLIEVIQESTT